HVTGVQTCALPICRAVDRCDHGLAHAIDRLHDAASRTHELLEAGDVPRLQELAHDRDVAAGGERPATADDHDDADVLRLLQALQALLDLFAHRPGERVEPLRTVDADPPDRAVFLDQHFARNAHPPTPSTTVAMPCPTPMHIVARPYPPPRRRSSRTRVVMIRAPEQPNGCPSAIAPPFTFTRSGSSSSSRTHATACAANASLSSINRRSAGAMPARSTALRVAGTGPMPIRSGSTPAT